jgi:ATP-dependent Clp protease ATP-binding subunit ClpC
MLLQILEDGYLTDAKGRRVDFRNTIILMTSNIGADLLKRDTSLGFSVKADEARTAEREYDKMKDKVLKELKNAFRPEFLNRLDGTVVFRSLTKEELRQIVDLLLKPVKKSLDAKGLNLDVSDEAKDLLCEKGYDSQYGARPLRRVIQNLIEDPLSERILDSSLNVGDILRIDRAGDDLEISVVPGVDDEPNEPSEPELATV